MKKMGDPALRISFAIIFFWFGILKPLGMSSAEELVKAKDGGYYLLGMKKLQSTLFENKAWGTASVLSDTLTSIENENFTLLSVKNDIDLYEDIREIDAFEPFIEHIKNDTGTT